MSVSIRALKRKNKYRNKERKQDKILTKANSLNSLNFQENIQAQPNLQVCKSESDVAKICSVPTATAMNFAKSERFLESIIQVNNNMQYVNQETSSIPNREAFRSSSTLRRPSIDPECSRQELQSKINIFGYEVMENRERFTIFKLKIENPALNGSWLVLRRYTDFVRLLNKLKTLFPNTNLQLPKKKWFGNNFSRNFIDNRIEGLQSFIQTIMFDPVMQHSAVVRDFFCLDDPPNHGLESMDECKAIFENQEETIQNLRKQLRNKDELIYSLEKELDFQIQKSADLGLMVKNNFEQCSKCLKN